MIRATMGAMMIAANPAMAPVVRDYAQAMLSWRLAHEDRTLTNLRRPYGE